MVSEDDEMADESKQKDRDTGKAPAAGGEEIDFDHMEAFLESEQAQPSGEAQGRKARDDIPRSADQN